MDSFLWKFSSCSTGFNFILLAPPKTIKSTSIASVISFGFQTIIIRFVATKYGSEVVRSWLVPDRNIVYLDVGFLSFLSFLPTICWGIIISNNASLHFQEMAD